MKQHLVDQFQRDGFLLLKNIADSETLELIRDVAQRDLVARVPPFELEADVHYPGSPENEQSEGGGTIRRLRQAWQRDPVLADWAADRRLIEPVMQLLGGKKLFLTQSHHNCIMTKQPDFSSETHWHRDCRYWSYNNCNLVSAWLALGQEQKDNGALRVIPGSHRQVLAAHQFEKQAFFREDLQENQLLIEKAVQLELEAGDLLLFHADLLHAAGKNTGPDAKMALVFTYHNEETLPLPGSRSGMFLEKQIIS